MKLPKQFQLFGKTIDIVEVDNLIQRSDADGLCDYRLGQISIQTNKNGWQRKEDQIEQALWHEITHAIFDAIGEDKLKEDERLVDLFSSALHQVIKTLK